MLKIAFVPTRSAAVVSAWAQKRAHLTGLEKRYRHLRDLLEEGMTQDIELWRIELARADCLAVVDVMMPSSSKRKTGKLKLA